MRLPVECVRLLHVCVMEMQACVLPVQDDATQELFFTRTLCSIWPRRRGTGRGERWPSLSLLVCLRRVEMFFISHWLCEINSAKIRILTKVKENMNSKPAENGVISPLLLTKHNTFRWKGFKIELGILGMLGIP